MEYLEEETHKKLVRDVLCKFREVKNLAARSSARNSVLELAKHFFQMTMFSKYMHL